MLISNLSTKISIFYLKYTFILSFVYMSLDNIIWTKKIMSNINFYRTLLIDINE